jgi:hypothetical protein
MFAKKLLGRNAARWFLSGLPVVTMVLAVVFVNSVAGAINADTVPPSAPQGLDATDPGTGQQVDLSWNSVLDEDLSG